MKTLTLMLHDLSIAFKNHSVYLLLFIPALICFSLKLVDDAGGKLPKTKLGLLFSDSYPPAMTTALESSHAVFDIEWIHSLDEAKAILKARAIDGVLRPIAHTATFELLVRQRESMRTAAILQNLEGVQSALERRPANWVAQISSLGAASVERSSIATWLLTLMLLVGFLIIPAQVAEEKEKKLLLGVLLTPIREVEWIAGKVLAGIVLAVGSIGLVHLFSGIGCENWLSYLGFLAVGGFYFSSLGVLLGMLCRTQASARALGVVFYLPHLLPSALSDFSQKMSVVARYIPSSQFYEPVRTLLTDSGVRITNFPIEIIYLLIGGGIGCALSHRLIRSRWLL